MLMFLAIFFMVFGITLFITFYFISSKRKESLDRQVNINDSALEKIKNSEFNATKIFYLNDYITTKKESDLKKFFAVDADKEKIAFIDYDNGGVYIVKFQELLNYEIYENNTSQTFGGYLGGFVGVLGAETKGVCRDLRLIIRFRNINFAQINYDIVNTSIGIVKSSGVYRDCIKTLQQAISFLEAIIEKNKGSKNTDE